MNLVLYIKVGSKAYCHDIMMNIMNRLNDIQSWYHVACGKNFSVGSWAIYQVT